MTDARDGLANTEFAQCFSPNRSLQMILSSPKTSARHALGTAAAKAQRTIARKLPMSMSNQDKGGRIAMGKSVRIGTMTVALTLGIGSLAFAKNQTIEASTTVDAGGFHIHTGTAATGGPSSVTCLSATGSGGQMGPARCSIKAPGYRGAVNVGQTIGTSGSGTVALNCMGPPPPITCSAKITGP